MQRVIVTGGFGALGQAVAHAFLAAGDTVALIDQSADRQDYRYPAVAGVDLSDLSAAKDAFSRARELLGGAEVLVNVAGGFRFAATSTGDTGAWDEMFAINLKTAANMCRAAVPHLGDRGAIVNVGAFAAGHASAGMAPYAAAKAGVARLTEALAAELAGRIRVNAVLPAVLDTPRNRADMPEADWTSWTAPAAVAEVIVFLSKGASRAINGALVPVTAPARR